MAAFSTDPRRRAAPDMEPVGLHEERRTVRPWHLATGSLACPCCDAPVTLAREPGQPTDAMACPFCDHAAALREFLTLEPPLRAPRVQVYVHMPAPV